MSSTEYLVDRRELQFVVNETLQAGKICELPDFAEFDEEMFTMIINEASTFAEQVLAPINQNGDRQGCRVENGAVVTPDGFADAWKKLGEGGWLSMSLPTEYGGQGIPEVIAVIGKETQMAANQGFTVGASLTTGAANLIYNFGSDVQKNDFCRKMFGGEWAGTMCLTEPHAGSAVGDVITSATRQEDGHYLIKGTKQFITNGDHDMSDNIVHLLLARTPDSQQGTKGISLFIVPKIRLDGVPNDIKLVSIEHKMGINGSPTCLLSFGDNDDCHGYLLEAENMGMEQMFKLMNEARLLVGLQGLAGASAAVQNAWDYAKERTQGPSSIHPGKKAPIIEFPDVRRMLMHMKAVTEGLRALMYTAAWYTDMANHGPEDDREKYQDLLDLHIPVCKAFGTDQGFDVARIGIQVLGGVGFTKDFPLEQNIRDQKIASIYEGTNGIQALDLVGRKFTVKNGQLLKTLEEELSWFDNRNLEGELNGWVAEWKNYRAVLMESIDCMKKIGEAKGQDGYLLYASNMMELIGDVLCCFHLLKQAETAQQKWNTMLSVVSSQDELLEENEEAQFYWNKLRTIEFYVWSILPRTLSNAKTIKNANLSPLNACL
ncbi:MAG: 3-methylmercaptopropionyl-CoA dehydrogenase [Deltaproteobacteria bacterium]|jgi:alkylation response protein AidB-like acyl-CoA dehydrogenase|nr:3-methylmercaptopropionyl-CoA dehydrogenase [Deltaproteobacteria bacterium]